MSVIRWIPGGFVVLLSAFTMSFPLAQAEDAGVTVLNSQSYYPEGPIEHSSGLLYAEMRRDRIMRWDGKRNETFWTGQGCGPTSIARWQSDGLVILCHLEGTLVSIDSEKRHLFTISEDSAGTPLVHPNDSVNDGHGGVYFTDSGVFHPEAPSTGKVYYLASDGEVTKGATGLRYANGIALLDSDTLLVSEHLSRRVLAFDVSTPGVLSGKRIFYQFGGVRNRGIQFSPALTGPDGIDVDREGNVYICEYGAGLLHVISAEGVLLTTLQTGLPLLTNVALSPDESQLTLTGSYTDPDRRPGKVIAVRNPINKSDVH
jgi:gluconolactonase